MVRYLDKIMIMLALLAALTTAFNLFSGNFKKLLTPSDTTTEIVVVDMLRIDIAQKRFVSDRLQANPGAQGIASAFRATKDVVAAARKVAPGKAIAVKQAFLYSPYDDITDEVLAELGLEQYSGGKGENVSSKLYTSSPSLSLSKMPPAVREEIKTNGDDENVSLPY